MRDTGIGIPRNSSGNIFEAFAQADHSTTRKYGGTGLGLTISSQLASMMGGRIWVESEPGQGSTFHFTARFGLTGDGAPPPPPAQPAHLHGLPVLVVDDNATNRRILRRGADQLADAAASRGRRGGGAGRAVRGGRGRASRTRWCCWTATCRRWTASRWRPGFRPTRR